MMAQIIDLKLKNDEDGGNEIGSSTGDSFSEYRWSLSQVSLIWWTTSPVCCKTAERDEENTSQITIASEIQETDYRYHGGRGLIEQRLNGCFLKNLCPR